LPTLVTPLGAMCVTTELPLEMCANRLHKHEHKADVANYENAECGNDDLTYAATQGPITLPIGLRLGPQDPRGTPANCGKAGSSGFHECLHDPLVKTHLGYSVVRLLTAPLAVFPDWHRLLRVNEVKEPVVVRT